MVLSDRDLLRIRCDLLRMVLFILASYTLMRYTLRDPHYPNLQFH